jgi:hypothetical protein
MLRILDLFSLGMEIVVIGGSTLTALWPGQAGDQGRGSRCDRSGR